jgi:hypothetical protein
MLVLLLLVVVAVYALLARWSRSERAHVGLGSGAIETTDDSADRAPTLRSMRAMLDATTPPEPSWAEGKCRACAFRHTCWGDDVD